MSKSSRSLAYTWPYARHRHFEKALRETAAKWFAAKGFPVHRRYKYILENWEDWPRNIILPEVAEYIRAEQEKRVVNRQGFPLHKSIHHGLSSQAMLFNLIGPLVSGGDLGPLQQTFEKQELYWPQGDVTASFEYEDREVFNEDSGQPTSIDLVISDSKGEPKVFIESKLVEREFGGCSVFASGDCDGRNPAQNFSWCYLHHIGRRYWELLKRHGFLSGPIGQESLCVLSMHYQFFRELLFALELNGWFVLLYDERNPTFFSDGPDGVRGLIPLMLSFVPEPLRNRVGAVSVQKVVQAIEETNRHEWITEFERKYGLMQS